MIRLKPRIEELRLVPILNQASFLKPNRISVLYPLTSEQAALLMAVIRARNPEMERVWRDFALGLDVALEDPELVDSGREGRLKLMVHFLRERDHQLVERKKRSVLDSRGRLACEVCGFDFENRYGTRGAGFCEVHHRLPLSRVVEETTTTLRDLAIVCSNCHRMLHREPEIDVEELARTFSGSPTSMR